MDNNTNNKVIFMTGIFLQQNKESLFLNYIVKELFKPCFSEIYIRFGDKIPRLEVSLFLYYKIL